MTRSGFTFSTGDCPPPELGSDPFKTVVGISGYDTLPHNDEVRQLWLIIVMVEMMILVG